MDGPFCILEPRSPGTGAAASVGEPGADRWRFGVPGPFVSELQHRRESAGIMSPTRVILEGYRDFPGLGGPLPETGYKLIRTLMRTFGRDMLIRIDGTSLRLAVANRVWLGRVRLFWPTSAVARLWRDLDEMKAGFRYLRTPGTQFSLRQPRQVTFTSTKVPKFAGVTSWEQYRQVFDAIVLSNGWDDATAALQLLSHLQGGALNVALLVPESRLSSRVGLVGAL